MYHQRIIEVLESRFGEDFRSLVVQHQYLPVIWKNCSDPEIMLEMLNLSEYRQGYFQELCDFARCLCVERQKTENDLIDFDDHLAIKKIECEKENAAKQSLRNLDECLWDVAHVYARDSIRFYLWPQANSASIFEDREPRSESEEMERRRMVQEKLWNEMAKKLRELIYDPFLPNAPHNNSFNRSAG